MTKLALTPSACPRLPSPDRKRTQVSRARFWTRSFRDSPHRPPRRRLPRRVAGL